MLSEREGVSDTLCTFLNWNFMCEFFLKIACHIQNDGWVSGGVEYNFSRFLIADSEFSHGTHRDDHDSDMGIQGALVVRVLGDVFLTAVVFIHEDTVERGVETGVDVREELFQRVGERLRGRHLSAVFITDRSVGEEADTTVEGASFSVQHGFGVYDEVWVSFGGDGGHSFDPFLIKLVGDERRSLCLDECGHMVGHNILSTYIHLS